MLNSIKTNNLENNEDGLNSIHFQENIVIWNVIINSLL